jgi:hypothetical protein
MIKRLKLTLVAGGVMPRRARRAHHRKRRAHVNAAVYHNGTGFNTVSANSAEALFAEAWITLYSPPLTLTAISLNGTQLQVPVVGTTDSIVGGSGTYYAGVVVYNGNPIDVSALSDNLH